MAIGKMVVYITHSLKICITDCSAEEFEPSFFHVGADSVGKWGGSRYVAKFLRVVYDDTPIG